MQELEGLVLRKNEFVVYDIAYDAHHQRLALSASAPYQHGRHLSVLSIDGNRIQYVTEGECQDANPVFDAQNPDQIYYDSCGFAYDQHGRVSIGPKRICLLNLRTGDLDSVLEDARYDFLKPQKDAQGNRLPYLNSVRYRPITDRSVEFANLQAGTITAADGLNPSDVASAQANPDLTYKQIPGLSFNGIELNTKMAPFDNPSVRQALNWGVNRQELVSIPLKGTATTAQGPIPSSSWAYDSHFEPYTYDVAKAKAALAQGGQANGISFTLSIASGSPLTLQVAQFIQSELQAAGIKMTIKQETFSALLNDAISHHFQAALLGWSGMPDPDENIYSFFHTGGGFNDMQYSNPQVDGLLDGARNTTNQQERATDYQKVEQIVGQDSPYIFLYHSVCMQATSAKLKNFTLLPTSILLFTNVYLEA